MSHRKGSKVSNKPLTERDDSSAGPSLDLSDQDLESLYAWVDSIPLSRPKKNISRDFADGVLVSEIVKHYFPHMVETHNYTAANSADKKCLNWQVLNRKVFSRMKFEVDENVINDLVQCKPKTIERFLFVLKSKLEAHKNSRDHHFDKPEVDQHLSPGRKDGRKQAKPHKHEEYGYLITQHYLDHKGWNSGVEQSMPRRQKMPIFDSDMVPRIMLEEREQEVLAKDEMVKILQAKISRLEHLLHLKDLRIDDLQNRVESIRPTGIRR